MSYLRIINAFTSGLQQITLHTFGLEAGIYNLQFYNIVGQTLLNTDITVSDYFNEFILQDKRMAAGIYILQLSGTQNNQPFEYTKKLHIVM